MDKCVVVAIGNNKARFFTLEPAEWPEYESGPDLVERKVLSYPTSNYGQSLWSKITNKHHQDSKVNKDRHYKFEPKFAREITSEIIHLVRINQGKKLILVAKPQILQLTRKFFTPTLFNHLQIEELNKDLSNFSSSQIHQYIAKKQLIPACRKVVYPL